MALQQKELNFEAIAADFERFLPFLAPVGETVVARLPQLPNDAQVLDVACGTGEPGLTLARRRPSVNLLGVDIAPTMVRLSQQKAEREKIENCRFEVMSVEGMALGNASVDAVISRFGLMVFGDLEKSAHEFARVLRKGGPFVLAVWDVRCYNTLARNVIKALTPHVPADVIEPVNRLMHLDAEPHLKAVGLESVRTELFEWHLDVGDDEQLWQYLAGPGPFQRLLQAVKEEERAQVRSEFLGLFESFRTSEGGYHIPHSCSIWEGTR